MSISRVVFSSGQETWSEAGQKTAAQPCRQLSLNAMHARLGKLVDLLLQNHDSSVSYEHPDIFDLRQGSRMLKEFEDIIMVFPADQLGSRLTCRDL